MQRQYVDHCRRLREAKEYAPHSYATWMPLQECLVRPIHSGGIAYSHITKLFEQRGLRHGVDLGGRSSFASAALERALVSRVAALIQDFDDGPRGGAPYVASVKTLRKCGVSRTNDGRTKRARPQVLRSGATHWQYSLGGPGSVCAVTSPGTAKCRLVYVVGPVRKPDERAISASLDANPYFSMGLSEAAHQRGVAQMRGRAAWHCCRLHHHCRVVATPEACCERVGSTLEDTWSARRSHGGLGMLIDRVAIREAGLVAAGGRRDESIVQNVLATLKTQKFSATTTERIARARGSDLSRALSSHRVGQDRLDADRGRGPAPEARPLDARTKRQVTGAPTRLPKMRLRDMRCARGKRWRPKMLAALVLVTFWCLAGVVVQNRCQMHVFVQKLGV